jgi:hypothetical protein
MYKGMPASSRFNPMRFFSPGVSKSEVYRRNIQDLPDVRNRIREAILKITHEMLGSVFNNAADQF